MSLYIEIKLIFQVKIMIELPVVHDVSGLKESSRA